MECAFCLTGKMGLVRNLTAGEIAGQVRVLARETGLLDERFNIVLMGMGEPLHNYDATMKALRILGDEHGLAVSPRRVTLSTVGVLPALERLASEPLMPNLAISLHATTDEQRDRLVPVNRKYGCEDLLDACRQFPAQAPQPHHVRVRDARRGQRHARGRAAAGAAAARHQGARSTCCRSTKRRASRSSGRPTSASIGSRRSSPITTSRCRCAARGRDIRAACGQLITESTRPAPGQRLAERLETLDSRQSSVDGRSR